MHIFNPLFYTKFYLERSLKRRRQKDLELSQIIFLSSKCNLSYLWTPPRNFQLLSRNNYPAADFNSKFLARPRPDKSSVITRVPPRTPFHQRAPLVLSWSFYLPDCLSLRFQIAQTPVRV